MLLTSTLYFMKLFFYTFTATILTGIFQISTYLSTLASMPEVLHPSWQAKRKEKELKIDISGCHGNKITFDDD